jgi:hypothetical protein
VKACWHLGVYEGKKVRYTRVETPLSRFSARIAVVVTEVRHDAISSIERLSEDHMLCTEVCDAQEPAGSTFCAREIHPTASPNTRAKDAHVTVMT